MPGQATVTIKDKQWSVTIANTYLELVSGLSGVKNMAPQTGMLFDLGYDQKYIAINMSEMLFPLDIIFINSTQGVVGVLQNVAPGLNAYLDNKTYPGARCFLEVNGGEASGIAFGDSVDIQGYVQAAQVDWIGLLTLIATTVPVVTGIAKTAGKVLGISKEKSAQRLPQTTPQPPPDYAEWKAKLQKGYGEYRPGVSEAQVEHEAKSVPKDVLRYYFREKIGGPHRYLPLTAQEIAQFKKRTGRMPTGVMPKLPPEARGDFLFFEYIHDLVKLGEVISDEDARQMWEASQRGSVSRLSRTVPGGEEKQKVIPTGKPGKGGLEYLADSPEFLTQTIEAIGYRDKIDTTFQEAIARARRTHGLTERITDGGDAVK